MVESLDRIKNERLRGERGFMSMVVLVVIIFGTDVSMTPMETMDECLDNARRVATIADWGNVNKEPRKWLVECKRLDIWLNS